MVFWLISIDKFMLITFLETTLFASPKIELIILFAMCSRFSWNNDLKLLAIITSRLANKTKIEILAHPRTAKPQKKISMSPLNKLQIVMNTFYALMNFNERMFIFIYNYMTFLSSIQMKTLFLFIIKRNYIMLHVGRTLTEIYIWL